MDFTRLQASILTAARTFNYAMDSYDLYLAADASKIAVSVADIYITKQEPWKLAKAEDPASRHKLDETLYTAAESIRIITALLYPILPYAAAQVWAPTRSRLHRRGRKSGALKDLKWGGLQPGTKLGPLAPIFPRAPKELIQTMIDIEEANAAARPSTPKSTFIDELSPTAAESHHSTHPAAAPRLASLPDENGGATRRRQRRSYHRAPRHSATRAIARIRSLRQRRCRIGRPRHYADRHRRLREDRSAGREDCRRGTHSQGR